MTNSATNLAANSVIKPAAQKQSEQSISAQAAQWLVMFSAEDIQASAEDYIAFNQWKNADSRHEQAINSMQKMLGDIDELPAKPTHAVLKTHNNIINSENENWASLAKVFSFMMMLLIPLSFMLWQKPLSVHMADLQTNRGEWKTHILADNTKLILSSNSAVNIMFNKQKRSIALLQGEVFVDVAPDANRPFVVTTEQGELQALGTRFVVTLHESNNETVLTVLESKVQAKAAFSANSSNSSSALLGASAGSSFDASSGTSSKQSHKKYTVVGAGQQIHLYNDHVSDIKQVNAANFERTWLAHQLNIKGKPLSEVLIRLAKYHSAYIYFNEEELAHIKVSAVLPLDDTDRALALLGESFPITIKKIAPWWLSIESVAETEKQK